MNYLICGHTPKMKYINFLSHKEVFKSATQRKQKQTIVTDTQDFLNT